MNSRRRKSSAAATAVLMREAAHIPPDLILMDGGKVQVPPEVLEDGLSWTSSSGMVRTGTGLPHRRERMKSWSSVRTVRLSISCSGSRKRSRFAITFPSRNPRKNSIAAIGQIESDEKPARKILKHFKTMKNIPSPATDIKALGIPEKTALLIKRNWAKRMVELFQAAPVRFRGV